MRTLIFTVSVEDNAEIPDVGTSGDWVSGEHELYSVRLVKIVVEEDKD